MILVISRFHDSGNHNARVLLLCLLNPRLPKCQNVLVFILLGFRDLGNHDASVPLLCLSNPQLPKCQNVLAFVLSGFHDARVPLLCLSNPRLVKCQNVLAFFLSGFHNSGNHDARVLLLCLLNPQFLKCQNVLAFDQQLTMTPEIYGPCPASLFHYLAIQGFGRQAPLSFQIVILEIAMWTNGPDMPVIDSSNPLVLSLKS
jgi:hypothetical protein